MIIGPKYKIARRLGAGIFEKTQGQKFALAESRRKIEKKRGGPKSDYGIQMLEKQKARYSYALTERQFSNYVKAAIAKKGENRDLLYKMLESRLDNVVTRAGFATTRLAARQLVSHGHILLNSKKVNIPSIQVKIGDKLTVREGSAKKPVFLALDERLKASFEATKVPAWLKVDPEKKVIEIQGAPKLNAGELMFDIGQVLEFYSR